MHQGLLLDRYELRDRLGRGGMAAVYRGYDHQLGRFVAVKLFERGTAVDDARRRGEASLLARLNHPNLVALHDAHLASDGDETPSFLVMELVEGHDLRTRLEEGPLAPETAAAIATDIAEALVAVHGAGMVHRDLKPANILLAEPAVPGARPVVKLADFGIAHLVGAERLTTAGTIIGTAGYLSPEQVNGEAGPPADIHALGLVVLEALTGVREYPGSPVEAVSARIARDPRIPASLPEDWRGLLAAMTARDPSLRPTAFEAAIMARELAPQLAGWTPEAEPRSDTPTRVLGGTTLGPVVLGGAADAAAATVAIADTAVTPATTPAQSTGATAPTVPTERRRRPRRRAVLGGVLAGGIAAVIAATLGLGSLMAPGATPETVPTTPRPTPSVTPPPAAVEPAVVPEEQQQPAQQQPAQEQPTQQQAPQNAGDGKAGNGGPGAGKGAGNGKTGKGQGSDSGNGKGKGGKG